MIKTFFNAYLHNQLTISLSCSQIEYKAHTRVLTPSGIITLIRLLNCSQIPFRRLVFDLLRSLFFSTVALSSLKIIVKKYV